MNVKKVLEIVKRQNYALGFRNLPVFEPNGELQISEARF